MTTELSAARVSVSRVPPAPSMCKSRTSAPSARPEASTCRPTHSPRSHPSAKDVSPSLGPSFRAPPQSRSLSPARCRSCGSLAHPLTGEGGWLLLSTLFADLLPSQGRDPNPRSRRARQERINSSCQLVQVHQPDQDGLQLLPLSVGSRRWSLRCPRSLPGPFYRRLPRRASALILRPDADRLNLLQNGSKQIIKNVRLNSVIGDA